MSMIHDVVRSMMYVCVLDADADTIVFMVAVYLSMNGVFVVLAACSVRCSKDEDKIRCK